MPEMGKKGVLDILTEEQLHYIVGRMAQPGAQIVSSDVKPVSEEGLAGFLGDHFRLLLCVRESNSVRTIHLFIKIVPTGNKPKADFINQNQFFKKEALVFQLIEEIQDIDYLNPWCTKAVIHSEKILVMPDLSIHGYKTHPSQAYFDRNHVLVTVSSLARFHAAFANYFTKRNQRQPGFLEENGFINEERLGDGSWLKAAAWVTYNVLQEFSPKAKQYPANLNDKLGQLYNEAYGSLDNNEDTLNVVIHKDLWANNIMFQYKDDVPVNAVLVDFQLSRYAPPAFDLMSLLFLTTSRGFRECYEAEILHHYYQVFSDNLDDATKKRLLNLNYDFEGFLNWCERARMYGMVQANATMPCICMDPAVGKATFDDPDTYLEHITGERTEPVLQHARENVQYKLRQLELAEEFVEKFVMNM